jgi:hypothetical protein
MIDCCNSLPAHRTGGSYDSNPLALTSARRRSHLRAAALSSILAALSVCPAPVMARPALVVVPAGTPLTVSVIRSVSSHNACTGDRFSFRATRAVVVHGWVVIRKDALGQGDVIQAEGAGRNGRPGKLGLRFRWISAADGSTIALSAARNVTDADRRRRTTPAITTASHLLGSAASLFGSASFLLLGPVGMVASSFLTPIARHFSWGRDVVIDPRRTLGAFVSREIHITAKRRAMTT